MGKPKRTKQRAGKLTYAQQWALMIGWDNSPRSLAKTGEMRTFQTIDEAREAWFAHRDEIYRTCNVGTRSWGWWRFESEDGLDRCGADGLLYLIESGELTDGEAHQLSKWGGDLWPPAAETISTSPKRATAIC